MSRFSLFNVLCMSLLIGMALVSHVDGYFETGIPTYRLKTIVGSNYTNGIPAVNYGVSDQLGSLAWKNGQLYFTEGSLVKKIDKSGNVYTIGGSSRINVGTSTNSGDSILATTALFSSYIPSLAVDPSNENLFVQDMGNNMIRRISFKTGLVSGVSTMTDSTARSLHMLNDRELLYASSFAKSIIKLDIRTSNSINFRELPMYSQVMRIKNETLYALDMEMGQVYKVFNNGTVVTLFNKDFLRSSLDVDSKGNVYVVSEGYKIFKFNTSGQLEQIAGDSVGFGGDGFPAIVSKISVVSDLVVNENDEVIFTDVDNNRIRKINNNGIMSTILGTSLDASSGLPPLLCAFNRIDSFAFHPNGLFFSDNGDYYNHKRLNKLDKGIVTSISSESVNGMVTDSNGTLYYIILRSNLVKKYNGSYFTVAGDGLMSNVQDGVNGLLSSVPNPTGIALYNNNLYVSSSTRIRIIYQNGTIDTVFFGSEEMNHLVVASDGVIYFLGSTSKAIYRVLNRNSTTRIIGGGTDTSNVVLNPTLAQLDNPTSFYVTTTKEFVIGELSRIRTCQLPGGAVIPLSFVEGEIPPSSVLDSPKSIFVKEYNSTLEISFASKGNIFTLTRELNETCFGVKANDVGVCSGRGLCTIYNLCTCNEPYGGPNCELSTCSNMLSDDPKSCSGRGQCQDGACNCEIGYKGINCEFRNMSCFGVSAELQNVCSGNGECSQQDVCSCSSGFYGSTCDLTYCYGYASNSPQVCNDRNGNCTSFNTCNCKPDYSGFNCNITYCDDLDNTFPNVCSSRGQCIAPETCRCNEGYYGKYCQDFGCFGIDYNNETVCSGRGVCSDFNTCECPSSNTGAMCEIDMCFGQPANTAQVCNYRNGTCTSLNTCSCRAGWIGMECSVPFCFGSFQQNFTCIPPVQDSNKEIIFENVKTINELNSLVVNFTKIDTNVFIKLPSSLSNYLNDTNQVPTSDISIIATMSKDETKGQLLSGVITLSFISNNQPLKITQLTEPIQIFFGKVFIPKSNMTQFNLTCAYFDILTDSWRTNGISTQFEYFNEELMNGVVNYVQFVTCNTTHLTSFSVIDQNFKKANSEYKGMPEPSQLRNDLISLNNEQIIILATTLGGSCLIIITVSLIVAVVIGLMVRAKRKRGGSYSKSKSCCCCF